MPTLPDLCVGYQHVDLGRPPRSDLLNSPPVVAAGADAVAAHQQWRQLVEHEEQALESTHRQQPEWFQVRKDGRHRVMPVIGGTANSWNSLIAGYVLAGIDAHFTTIRVANLSHWPVLETLTRIAQGAKKANLRFDSVGANGSSVDLFTSKSPRDLAGFVVDVLRATSDPQGRREAGREKADLLAVADLLQPPVDLAKLTAAIDVSLGAINLGSLGHIGRSEERALRDFHHDVVTQRRATGDRLEGLHADLCELERYSRSTQAQTVKMGSGAARIRSLSLSSGLAVHEMELGRQLIAASVARAFARRAGGLEMLIIVGAEFVSKELLDNLKSSAEHLGKQLILMFGEMSALAERTLGSGGSEFAAFLRLPNPGDAEAAARYFGREFTFVVDGITIAEGRTEEWNQTYGTNSTRATTRTSDFGHLFASSVSRSMAESSSDTHGTGGSTSRTATKSLGRVHDFVVEPEQFQHLDDDVVLVVDGQRVVLATCDFRVRNSKRASLTTLSLP